MKQSNVSTRSGITISKTPDEMRVTWSDRSPSWILFGYGTSVSLIGLTSVNNAPLIGPVRICVSLACLVVWVVLAGTVGVQCLVRNKVDLYKESQRIHILTWPTVRSIAFSQVDGIEITDFKSTTHWRLEVAILYSKFPSGPIKRLRIHSRRGRRRIVVPDDRIVVPDDRIVVPEDSCWLAAELLTFIGVELTQKPG